MLDPFIVLLSKNTFLRTIAFYKCSISKSDPGPIILQTYFFYAMPDVLALASIWNLWVETIMDVDSIHEAFHGKRCHSTAGQCASMFVCDNKHVNMEAGGAATFHGHNIAGICFLFGESMAASRSEHAGLFQRPTGLAPRKPRNIYHFTREYRI